MAKYYVYCETHGRLTPDYNSADQASIARKKHIINTSGPHYRVNVIEEYAQKKYGQTIKNLRQVVKKKR
ncbi:hypothetical protein [Roseivirga echinicomitans]|uniref:Uncharacterized protein n=1 Tax=Roseivirga echinicomitans TaxID=296218 RepID=A0A150X239_9BACT|nr:hypothetical protein [Roseivirga echinicomitans]KYG72789.1 hypothetical protein AWN68_08790 [Roseivirga echinicomitans]